MIIGIYSLRNHRYHPNRRLFEAARDLNHQAILVNPKKLLMEVSDQGLRIDSVTRSLQVDVIMPRIGANIKEYALTMVRHFELMGITVINNFESILLARNKLLTVQTLFQKGIPVPESRYVSNWSNFEKAVSSLDCFPLVIKKPFSRQGKGVYLIDSIEKSRPLLDGLLNTVEGLLVQKFIPPEKRREIRIMVVGESVIGAMSLIPKKGDFRSNVHLNGRTEKIDPTEEMSTIAIKSTQAVGLDISGVDIIEEENGALRVIDVNYSPGFKGLEKCTGKNIAAEIIRYVTKSVR